MGVDNRVLTSELTPDQVMCLVHLCYAAGQIRTAVECETKGIHVPTDPIDQAYRKAHELVIHKLILSQDVEYIRRKLTAFEEMYQTYAALTSD